MTGRCIKDVTLLYERSIDLTGFEEVPPWRRPNGTPTWPKRRSPPRQGFRRPAEALLRQVRNPVKSRVFEGTALKRVVPFFCFNHFQGVQKVYAHLLERLKSPSKHPKSVLPKKCTIRKDSIPQKVYQHKQLSSIFQTRIQRL